MASLIYDAFKLALANGSHDLDLASAYRIMLVTSLYTPNQASDANRSNVTNEVSGTGYSQKTLANTTLSVATNRVKWDCDDITWTSATFTAYAAVVYYNSGNPNTDKLVAYYDFGGDRPVSAGDFTFQVNANGLLQIQ